MQGFFQSRVFPFMLGTQTEIAPPRCQKRFTASTIQRSTSTRCNFRALGNIRSRSKGTSDRLQEMVVTRSLPVYQTVWREFSRLDLLKPSKFLFQGASVFMCTCCLAERSKESNTFKNHSPHLNSVRSVGMPVILCMELEQWATTELLQCTALKFLVFLKLVTSPRAWKVGSCVPQKLQANTVTCAGYSLPKCQVNTIEYVSEPVIIIYSSYINRFHMIHGSCALAIRGIHIVLLFAWVSPQRLGISDISTPPFYCTASFAFSALQP